MTRRPRAARAPGRAAPAPLALAALAAAAALACLGAGCGPRTTFDRFDKIAFAPLRVGERVDPEVVSATAEVPRALAHYMTAGRMFREARIGTATADATTVIAEPLVTAYVRDADRFPYGIVLGGKARGHAVVEYVFRDAGGKAIWEEEIRSIARDFDGVYTDLPPALGGVDATAEGAGAYLLWWMRRSKSNPREAAAAPTATAAPPR